MSPYFCSLTVAFEAGFCYARNKMNEMMNMNALTMSSLEIAKLTGKTHDNVLKDIRRILDEVEIDHVQFNAIFLDAYKREQPCFNLPRIECDLIVSGYSAPYRFAIIN
jgi:phage regulator Rha-like protein